MTVTLSEEMFQVAESHATAGGYATVGEYLETLIDKADLQADVDAGISELEAGKGRPAREVFAEFAAKNGIELGQ